MFGAFCDSKSLKNGKSPMAPGGRRLKLHILMKYDNPKD